MLVHSCINTLHFGDEDGIHLKQSKCEFMKHSVVFLGHKVDSQGVHPAGATLDAIRDARPPTNLTELRSFIGMVNHYARKITRSLTFSIPKSEKIRNGSLHFFNEIEGPSIILLRNNNNKQ